MSFLLLQRGGPSERANGLATVRGSARSEMRRPVSRRLVRFLLFALSIAGHFLWKGVSPVPAQANPTAQEVAALGNRGSWTTYSTRDGLASNSVLALEKTSTGHLWVATNSGVSVRSHPGEWLTLTDADGLGGNLVLDVKTDPSNVWRHWFATDHGVSLLDDGQSPLNQADDRWVTFRKADGLVNRHAWAVAVGNDGKVWVGTNYIDGDGNEHGYGLSVLELKATPFDKSDDVWTTHTAADGNLSHDIVRDIAVDPQGTVWIATANGLNAYNSGSWTTYSTADGLPSNNTGGLLTVGDLLWVSTVQGLAVLDCGGTPHQKGDDRWGVFTQYNSGLVDNDTTRLSVDGAGRIWVGTAQASSSGETGHGFSVLDTAGTPFDRSDDRWVSYGTSSGLAHNAVRALAVSGTGTAWIGTKDGLSQLDYHSSPFVRADNRWTTHRADARLAGSAVHAVAAAGPGGMWLGTERGLSLLLHNGTLHFKGDDRWTTFTADDGLAANEIKALAQDADGRVWIGTSGGLTILDPRGTLEDKQDDLHLTYTSDSGLVHDQVNDIVLDRTGQGWLACGSYFGGGLHVLDLGNSLSSRSDDRWATFTTGNSGLPHSYVTSVALGSDAVAWVGTYGGAARFAHGNTPFDTWDDQRTSFTSQNSGLAYNTVRDVAIDLAGNAWFGLAIEGASARNRDGEWVTFGRADGLAYDAVHAVAVDCLGTVWLGTDGGGISRLAYHRTLRSKGDDIWEGFARGQALLSGNIREIEPNDCREVWVGTFGGGVSVYTPPELFLPIAIKAN